MGEISRAEVADTVASLRRVLGALDAEELSCSAAYRNRLEGAVVALGTLARDERGPDTTAP